MIIETKEFVKPSKTTLTAFGEFGIPTRSGYRSKLLYWVKKYQADIILFIGVILISLLSFALGYILAKQEDKEPLRFEINNEQ